MSPKKSKHIEEQLVQLAHFLERQQPKTGHKIRFEKRLKAQQKKRSVHFIRTIYWAAATVALLISYTASVQFFNPKPIVSPEFDEAITYYTQYIDKQIAEIEHPNNIEYIAIIDDAKEQLQQLEAEYKRLISEFSSETFHPLLIQAMVENLQHQATVLRKLEVKINSLKKTNYEKEIF